MCGPLVMMLGKHTYRHYYFFGRLFSFTLAGLLSATLGLILHTSIKNIHLSAYISMLLGFLFVGVGVFTFSNYTIPLPVELKRIFSRLGVKLSKLILKDSAKGCFLFGFFTLLLPCGQSLLVFSACALAGDPLTGLINGFAFSLLTSPALIGALFAHKILPQGNGYYQVAVAFSSVTTGIIAMLRGLAEMDYIPHLTLLSSDWVHLTIY
jgi:sulfite exporter TauE/SafE